MTRDYTDYPGTGPRSNSSFFATQGDEVVQLGVVDESGSMQVLEPVAPVYVLSPREGDGLDYEGALGTTPLRLRTTVSDVGEVEVGGHTFDDCARWVTETTIESEGQPDFVVETEEWTCPGFGTVRTVETNEANDTEVTEELIEFHGAAGNWYADGHEPDAPRAEPVAGGAEAFDAHRTLAVPDGRIGRRLAWSDVRAQPPLFPAVTDGDVVVTAERDGQVTARSRETGEPRWRVDLGAPIMATPRSPVTASWWRTARAGSGPSHWRTATRSGCEGSATSPPRAPASPTTESSSRPTTRRSRCSPSRTAPRSGSGPVATCTHPGRGRGRHCLCRRRVRRRGRAGHRGRHRTLVAHDRRRHRPGAGPRRWDRSGAGGRPQRAGPCLRRVRRRRTLGQRHARCLAPDERGERRGGGVQHQRPTGRPRRHHR